MSDFLNQMNWSKLIFYGFYAFSALFCITVHELCHGLAAKCLGDPTAKQMGRLSLNPLRHIDLFGLLMLVTVQVGWAKPVPINMTYFKHPKRDMAITSLAGPASNFVLAWAVLLLSRLLMWLQPTGTVWGYVYLMLLYTAVLSVGLGVFNLIPLPPLDGSKVVLAFLPDRICYQILRLERYGMLILVALVWFGVFTGPLTVLRAEAMRIVCTLSGFPYDIIQYYFN
ncbi:MAG: site-2 protease family protein [Oscillospiraceae bacterium]|nr:site-2 protease family protein [Oscillospiraceae bacterium]